jgi:hypothetical protein
MSRLKGSLNTFTTAQTRPRQRETWFIEADNHTSGTQLWNSPRITRMTRIWILEARFRNALGILKSVQSV